MSHTESLPSPGQIARVRERFYLVEDVRPGKRAKDSSLVRLSCVDDDNQGQPLEVLWKNEIAPQVLTAESWDALATKGFDEPSTFAAYLNTLKWNCVTSTDAKLFQSPFRAGIRLEAYQLEPLRKALLLPRVNLFIADDVGLGKTIEAGLIARELLLRKKAREIYVSCPPSMLYQWKDELDARFGLTFEILDREYVRRMRQERGFSVNPWSTHTRFLISHRLLIDEAYTGPLRDHLGLFRKGALFILDEAHHAAPSSGAKYAIDSRITKAIRSLACRFEHRLFLSATPHNGHSNSFSALLEILDPQRFCRGVKVKDELRKEVFVRRIKEDIRALQGGFPERCIRQVSIDGLDPFTPELHLSYLLNEYRLLREQRLQDETKRQRAASGLLLTGLQQRLLSSVEAFARTLAVHRKTVKRQWNAQQQLAPENDLPLTDLDLLSAGVDPDDERATLNEIELQAEEDAQFESASLASIGPYENHAAALFNREQELLQQMTEIADSARDQSDARVERLLEWLRQHMCPQLGEDGAPWTDTRVLIFTEYDDTKRYLLQQLQGAIAGTERADERIAVYHGPTPPRRREEIKQAFNTDPQQHPVRILIATDAAREGLNLQAWCHNLFHFDIPWNPSRMEQRNGRIDRKLQPAPRVFCHYFVYRQRPEDRILEVLIRKTETIKQELGSLSQVIDAQLAKTLRQGISHTRLDSLEEQIATADLNSDRRDAINTELESARVRRHELKLEIEHLRTSLEKSKRQIGLNDDAFRSAISSSLMLLGGGQLTPDRCDDSIDGFEFPPLDERAGADATWADTMDSLRTPRKRDQKLWDWRRDTSYRPVVFSDPGVLSHDYVHLHLEQRVVRRLLGRFTAQGFVHDDISRACFAVGTDPVPRVVLLGRLCLYGPEAARLHEELVPVTARWTDPEIRSQPLSPYAKDTQQKTMRLLEQSLLNPRTDRVTQTVQDLLQSSASKDITELLPHLQGVGEAHADKARLKLQQRGHDEANAMTQILKSQQRHIIETENEWARLKDTQLSLFDREEQQQVENNRAHWKARIEEIKGELTTEPQRITELYDVKATRIEPVGLVYLWPVTS